MYLIEFFKKSKSTLIFLLFFTLIFVPILYFLVKPKTALPVYNPIDVNPRLVDDAVKHVSKDHKVADFRLINQNGEIITQDNFKDKIYISDFFFTRCQSICPIMTVNMADLQEYFKNDDEIKFLSHSVTPIIDSVSVLKAYAIKNGAIYGNGILQQAIKSTFMNLLENLILLF
jgi:protein SCO1/2